MYNKLADTIILVWFAFIVSACMFVVLFNRSLKPNSSKMNHRTNWRLGRKVKLDDKPDYESAARMQGEANHNIKYIY